MPKPSYNSILPALREAQSSPIVTIDDEVDERLEEILSEIFPNGRIEGAEYRMGDVEGNPGNSLSMNLDEKRGVWRDFATQDSGKGLISLVAAHLDGDREAAINLVIAKLEEKKGAQQRPADGETRIIYHYKDASGGDLYEVHRIELGEGTGRKKTFRMRDSRSGAWSVAHESRPIYNLPDLAARTTEPVVVVEGEKCADALMCLGILATTCMGSSGGVPRADWGPLKNRSVVIWPDHDEPGLKFAAGVTEALHEIEGVEITVYEPSEELPAKWDAADAVASGWDQARCLDELSNAVEAGSFIEKHMAALQKTGKADAADKKKNLPLLAAKALYRSLPHAVAVGGTVWYWSEKHVFEQITDHYLRRMAQLHFGPKASSGGVSSAVEIFKNMIAAKTNPFVEDRHELIVHAQGADLSWNGAAFIQTPPDPETFTLVRLPWEFQPDAVCPEFLAYLRGIFSVDQDINEKISLVQEVLGACLTLATPWPVLVFLIGPGANGKSVFVDLVEALLGRDNTASVSPSGFADRFSKALLEGKLANLVPELNVGERLEDATLKQLSSGDIIQVEQKFKDPRTTRIGATNIFASNSLPYSRDISHGIQRRIRFIPFNRIFAPREQDTGLTKRLIENEMPGILAFALEGLARVIRNNGFSTPKSHSDMLIEWVQRVDPLQKFLHEECAFEKELTVRSEELYARYSEWTDRMRIRKVLSQPEFTHRLKATCAGIEFKRTSSHRLIAGIGLRCAPKVICDDDGVIDMRASIVRRVKARAE